MCKCVVVAFLFLSRVLSEGCAHRTIRSRSNSSDADTTGGSSSEASPALERQDSKSMVADVINGTDKGLSEFPPHSVFVLSRLIRYVLCCDMPFWALPC